MNAYPKLYSPVKLRFTSFRGALGPNMGFVEIEEEVERVAIRVRCKGRGWAWQIKGILNKDWDYTVAIDQDVLNECRDQVLEDYMKETNCD